MDITQYGEGGSPFDKIRHFDKDGNEYWVARELMPLLGYEQWRRFASAIERAKVACTNSGQSSADHFATSGKMIEIGKGGMREAGDYHLTRYACYLVALNGDPRKPEIAAAQSYFAVRARQAELSTDLATLLSTVESLRYDVNQMKNIMDENRQAAMALPEPLYILPGMTRAEEIKEAINTYCTMTRSASGAVHELIYREMRYRSPNVDIKARCRNAKKKHQWKGSVFQYAVEHGFADLMYAIIYEKIRYQLKLQAA